MRRDGGAEVVESVPFAERDGRELVLVRLPRERLVRVELERDGTAESPTRKREASAELLVRLLVEPHPEQRELRARDQEQRHEDDRRGRDLVVEEDARAGDDEAEEKPEHRHQRAEHVEEDERVEVADHVLLLHPPPEALEEEPRDPRRDRADLDPGALADAVDRARRHVAHAGGDDVQVHEHVVREPVAAVDPLEVEPVERRE